MFTASNIHYELSERFGGVNVGGIGAIQLLAGQTGLTEAIDRKLHLLKVHLPYHESDHVLNIAYNILCGGERLEHIELRRKRRGVPGRPGGAANSRSDHGGRLLSSVRRERHRGLDGGDQRNSFGSVAPPADGFL